MAKTTDMSGGTVFFVSTVAMSMFVSTVYSASFSLTRGALLRSDRAAPTSRFDPHSKWGKYWINSVVQSNRPAPSYAGSYGKRFYYPYYRTASEDGEESDNKERSPTNAMNDATLRFG